MVQLFFLEPNVFSIKAAKTVINALEPADQLMILMYNPKNLRSDLRQSYVKAADFLFNLNKSQVIVEYLSEASLDLFSKVIKTISGDGLDIQNVIVTKAVEAVAESVGANILIAKNVCYVPSINPKNASKIPVSVLADGQDGEILNPFQTLFLEELEELANSLGLEFITPVELAESIRLAKVMVTDPSQFLNMSKKEIFYTKMVTFLLESRKGSL